MRPNCLVFAFRAAPPLLPTSPRFCAPMTRSVRLSVCCQKTYVLGTHLTPKVSCTMAEELLRHQQPVESRSRWVPTVWSRCAEGCAWQANAGDHCLGMAGCFAACAPSTACSSSCCKRCEYTEPSPQDETHDHGTAQLGLVHGGRSAYALSCLCMACPVCWAVERGAILQLASLTGADQHCAALLTKCNAPGSSSCACVQGL